MKKPKMIMFDYGQTLVDEGRFDGIKGTQAVLKYAIRNKYGHSAKDIQAFADEINFEIGRTDPERRCDFIIEVPNYMFTAYIYEAMGIELSLTPQEIDNIFWEAATDGKPTDGIDEFLAFLKQKDIRTGVISNISYCGKAVEERIDKIIPSHNFEFILATSEYIFRKPNRRIFEFALKKAELKPDDVWYVGDNYNCDIIGATTAGITPIWYRGADDTNSNEMGKCITVSHWRELRDILETTE